MKWRFSNNRINKSAVIKREQSKTVMLNMVTSASFGTRSFWWQLRTLGLEGIIAFRSFTIEVSQATAIEILSDEFTDCDSYNEATIVERDSGTWHWFVRSSENGDTDIACLYTNNDGDLAVSLWGNLEYQKEIKDVIEKLITPEKE